MPSYPLFTTSLVCLCMALSGCGGAPADAPEAVSVSGKVTRKGTALAGVNIEYTPVEKDADGRIVSSTGFTDENGEYTLNISRSLEGAVIGKHLVRLTLDDGVDENDKPVDNEIVIPAKLGIREVEVPADGLDGGAADFDLDF